MRVVITCTYVAALLSTATCLSASDRIQILSKEWESGYSAKNAQQELHEYVLPGQTVHDWTELVTRQVLSDSTSKVPLDRFIQQIRRGFGTDCKDLVWRIESQTETEVLYSWAHAGCSKYPAQAERSLLRRVPRGICRWAYATKSPPLSVDSALALDKDLANQSCD